MRYSLFLKVVMTEYHSLLISKKLKIDYLNPFLANVPILYPLKTPENLWFSGVFRGYKMGAFARNWFNVSFLSSLVFLPVSSSQGKSLFENDCFKQTIPLQFM